MDGGQSQVGLRSFVFVFVIRVRPPTHAHEHEPRTRVREDLRLKAASEAFILLGALGKNTQ
jgi:hypothetical protein